MSRFYRVLANIGNTANLEGWKFEVRNQISFEDYLVGRANHDIFDTSGWDKYEELVHQEALELAKQDEARALHDLDDLLFRYNRQLDYTEVVLVGSSPSIVITAKTKQGFANLDNQGKQEQTNLTNTMIRRVGYLLDSDVLDGNNCLPKMTDGDFAYWAN